MQFIILPQWPGLCCDLVLLCGNDWRITGLTNGGLADYGLADDGLMPAIISSLARRQF